MINAQKQYVLHVICPVHVKMFYLRIMRFYDFSQYILVFISVHTYNCTKFLTSYLFGYCVELLIEWHNWSLLKNDNELCSEIIFSNLFMQF